MQKIIWLILLLCDSGLYGVYAASIEIWPADRRENKEVLCIAGEANHIAFQINASNNGQRFKYKPKTFVPSTKLVFDLPKTLPYLGTIDFRKSEHYAKEEPTEEIHYKGKVLIRHTIPLDAKILDERLIKHRWYYNVFVWIHPPKHTRAEMRWRLVHDGKELASGINTIRTVGAIDANRPLPKNFFLYLWYPNQNLPIDQIASQISFYKRLGITHFNLQYTGEGYSPTRIEWAKKLRKAGIKIMAERFGGLGNSLVKPGGYKDKGLVWGSRELCERLQNQKKKEFSKVAKYCDGYQWDFEPHGPGAIPGYDDKATLAAFATQKSIKDGLNKEIVKRKYKQEYYDFRMTLLCDPIRALSKMIRSFNPKFKIMLCQGSGLPIGPLLDPRNYDAAVDYHLPMLYIKDAKKFHDKVAGLAKYLNSRKLIPVDTMGWSFGDLTRLYPEGLRMDYVAAASCGCAGLAHWPGLARMDEGAMYGFYLGGVAVAPVEEIYQKGELIKYVEVQPLPFIQKKVTVGKRVLDMSQPVWKSYLVSKVHRYKGETLITILNYHPDQPAFVRIRTDAIKKGSYLVDSAARTRLRSRSTDQWDSKALRKGILVQVPPMSPGLWLITTNKDRLQNSTVVYMDDVKKAYAEKKATFAAQSPSNIQLGKNGAINVRYVETPGSKEVEICIQVSTPEQSIAFTENGGRIWKWRVGKMRMVDGHDNTTGGVVMDLLWLPKSARWSGDQIRFMKLSKCVNNGTSVTLVYNGEFKTALQDVTEEKTFTVHAKGTRIDVSVRIKNQTVQPTALSYWSHNVFPAAPGERVFMVRNGETVTVLPFAHKQRWFTPKQADPVMGEYFSKRRCGVIFRVPADFLHLYRYESGGSEAATVEWMQQERTIPAGKSITYMFSIEAYENVAPVDFKKIMLTDRK